MIPTALPRRIGFAPIRFSSLYQPRCRTLRDDSLSGSVKRNPARFLCSFRTINHKLYTGEMQK